MKTNKAKIINDPVHGFITLDNELLYDIVSHRYFQRLLRIRQLGMSYLVYPGAVHSRFSHALGTMFLMKKAIGVLRNKGVVITDDEALAAQAAILLHDVGHGPFSHCLEHFIIQGVEHETLSKLFMHRINDELGGRLTLAIRIFEGSYGKKFLHQLISSQLDMDRLDYLNRDSFFAGVSEGIVGTERIINMLNVHNDNLVVDEKGIYSIEKFIISRRLMYWQVYMHKTVIAADEVMRNLLKRAKLLMNSGMELPCSEYLRFFFTNSLTLDDLDANPEILEKFALLDDSDIISAAKMWTAHPDFVLSQLAKQLINRGLPCIEVGGEPVEESRVAHYRRMFEQKYGVTSAESEYFVCGGRLQNHAYDFQDQEIEILFKNGRCAGISEASDQLDHDFLAKTVTKYYICYPKEFRG